MNLSQLLQQIVSSFVSAIGWRAASIMPVWLAVIIAIIALVFGVNW